MNKFLLILSILPVFISFSGCTNPQKNLETASGEFVIRNFNPLSNWHIDSTGHETRNESADRSINLDYTGAMTDGFIIPTLNQVREGQFIMEFEIKNTGKTGQVFCYKIYYQNESYKFPERDATDSTLQHFNAWENFYGSWEDVSRTFAETVRVPADNEFHKIRDSFRITGNPRDEKRFYANGNNDRWKRNPRVGRYSFLLVVTQKENIINKIIPDYIADITQTLNQRFVNPYFYFLYGQGNHLANTIVRKSLYTLKVIAQPDPGAGIYITPLFFKDENSKRYLCKTCGSDSMLSRNAPFEQFMNFIDPSTKLNNIPVIKDVLKDNYSKLDYNWNRQFYRKEELIASTTTTSKLPCQTVSSDPVNHEITIKNPGTEYGKWEKQNVGIITRHGFTYGKWTIKAKLTELLNKNNMWNGLTNAIWLITQSQTDWNIRRDCNKEGYLANYYGGQTDKRVKAVAYSEIDFEILKTVPYCPSWVLPPAYNYGIPDQDHLGNWNVPFPEEIINDDDKIEVCLTNWDMACWEPTDFNDGCHVITYQNQDFWAHRWDKGYRALTEKTPERDDELFGSDYFYFQIDWEPTEIIWRIGPSKDKLRVVGYMNDKVTSIPNNQMLLIVSQEFHNTKWWIGSQYSQDNIPFPKNDIIGKIFEITIE